MENQPCSGSIKTFCYKDFQGYSHPHNMYRIYYRLENGRNQQVGSPVPLPTTAYGIEKSSDVNLIATAAAPARPSTQILTDTTVASSSQNIPNTLAVGFRHHLSPAAWPPTPAMTSSETYALPIAASPPGLVQSASALIAARHSWS